MERIYFILSQLITELILKFVEIMPVPN